jgi:hypothetical protein
MTAALSAVRNKCVCLRFSLSVLLVLAGGMSHSVLAQTVKFNAPVSLSAGRPFVVAAGDLNGDGKADLVGGDVTNNDLLVLLGNGDGTLQAPATYHQTSRPFFLVTTDFNRDGKLDVAFGDSPSPAGISVLLGKGDGSFEAPSNYAVPGWHFLAADLNNDGKPDIVTAPTTTSIAVLLNNGNGTFQNPQTYPIAQPIVRVFAVADFNGDGVADLFTLGRMTAGNSMRFISVLLGNGDGTFQIPMNSNGNWGQGSGPYSIAVGDFDRDGKTDVAVTDEFLTVLRGNGDGTFKTPAAPMAVLNTSTDVKASDFNGDGKLDLVSAGVFSGNNLQLLLGKGDGSFQDAGSLVNNVGGVSVVVSDLNADTRPDVAACVNGQLTISLVNATPGDTNNTDYFVHQQYMDFLDREPDASGFAFWSNEISSCASDLQCLELKRVNTSAAFYLSIEFQRTGYMIERLYKTAYGDSAGTSATGSTHQLPVPIVHLNELLIDTRQINLGVVVLQPGWSTVLETNTQNFLAQFVQRPRFQSALPMSLTPADFVNKLDENAGHVLTANERAALVGLFGGASDTKDRSARAQVLRTVADNRNLYESEFNKAFVLIQYFGYLRRDPNDGPDSDYSGYEFWLNKLHSFNGNYVSAEMVKAFISSIEYRQRFQQ